MNTSVSEGTQAAREPVSGTIPEAQVHLVGTAWGTLGFVSRGETVCRVVLPMPEGSEVLEKVAAVGIAAVPRPVPPSLARLAEALVAYFDGAMVDPAAIAVGLDYGPAGPFVRRVYDALRKVPRGSVVSYGELAERAGSPGAARAVGQAMAKNALPLLVPCHRVLASGARLGGFSAPGGVAKKRELLRMEGWIKD
jgi:methylated-DNA-[protein]-cysteine S-methyltransferase